MISEIAVADLKEKYNITGALFLVDGIPLLQAVVHPYSIRFQHVTHRNRTTVKYIFKLVKHWNNQFEN